MKIAITGHTQGIGKCAFERLSPNIIGFSKSTGYDITKFNDRKRIIEESKDCDIFINNANAGFGQTYLKSGEKLIKQLSTWEVELLKLQFSPKHINI